MDLKALVRQHENAAGKRYTHSRREVNRILKAGSVVRPHHEGFNQWFREAVVNGEYPEISETKINCRREGPLPFQSLAKTLVSPSMATDRFLCAWRTGAGKTYGMILILSQFYKDPRPKIIIFPESSLVRNFYEEVLTHPSPYRNFLARKMTGNPELGEKAVEEWAKGMLVPERFRKHYQEIQDILACKGQLSVYRNQPRRGELLLGKHPAPSAEWDDDNYLRAPIRAFRYTIAGGSGAMSKGNIQAPFNIKLTEASAKDTTNPYSGMIVIMDEFHNLLGAENKEYLKDSAYHSAQSNLKNMKRWLETAKDSVIVGMTATPILKKPSDGDVLLNVLKGRDSSRTTDGMISYFDFLDPHMYPIPSQDARTLFTDIKRVVLKGENREVYCSKHFAAKSLNTKKQLRRVSNYCNIAHFANGRMLSRDTIEKKMKDLPSFATKFSAILEDAFGNPQEKTLILIHRVEGWKHLVNLFLAYRASKIKEGCPDTCSLLAVPANCPPCVSGASDLSKGKYNPKSMLIGDFKSPETKSGVFVADSENYSEGVSFKGVDHLILANPSASWSEHMQRIGRIIRGCDSPGRRVRITLYIAVLKEKKEKQLRLKDVSQCDFDDECPEKQQCLNHFCLEPKDNMAGGGARKTKRKKPARKKKEIKEPEQTVDEILLDTLLEDARILTTALRGKFEHTAVDYGFYTGLFDPRCDTYQKRSDKNLCLASIKKKCQYKDSVCWPASSKYTAEQWMEKIIYPKCDRKPCNMTECELYGDKCAPRLLSDIQLARHLQGSPSSRNLSRELRNAIHGKKPQEQAETITTPRNDFDKMRLNQLIRNALKSL